MGEDSKIGWTHHTFNPWEGCVKVSEECDSCYAEERDKRWHGGRNWGKDAFRLFHVDAYWKQIAKWNREAEAAGVRRRVFCGSLCDIMEDRLGLLEPRQRLYDEIENAPWLNFLLLSKRPQNYTRFLPRPWVKEPRANVWLGTTCGASKSLWRVDELKKCPAVIHFLSIEPLLEDLPTLGDHLQGIDWAIFGGESGKHARPCDLTWIRRGLDTCVDYGLRLFVKQLGAKPFNGFNVKNEVGHKPEPFWLSLSHPAGADPSEWPLDLRVQEYPAVRNASGI